MTTQKRKLSNQYSEFAYEVLMDLIGGESKATSEVLDAMAQVCEMNYNIKTFAGMYLVGSSTRADYNLNNLKSELRRVFNLKGGN